MENTPMELKPISPWGYVGYSILFMLPIIGLILLIVKAVSAPNINVKNYARGVLLCWAIMIVVGIILMIVFGASMTAMMKF